LATVLDVWGRIVRGDRRRQYTKLAELRRTPADDLRVVIQVTDMMTDVLRQVADKITETVKAMGQTAYTMYGFSEMYQSRYNPADGVIEGEYVEVLPETRRLQGVHFADIIIDELPR
jgi:hypothetical protein